MRKNHRLLRNKEDQSKYYLSYPKPLLLAMKWESGDINVVERASIPKFSKLGDIVTPLRFLELFFDDVLVDMIVGYSKLYSHREREQTLVLKLLMKNFAYS